MRPDVTDLSRRVSTTLAQADSLTQDERVRVVLPLVANLADAADWHDDHRDAILASTLRGWIGKVQRAHGFQ